MEKRDSKTVPRILIVDDVETNRFILRDIILEMNYQPVLTENGIQALKMMQYAKPQLVILDIAMPGMDGYEVCRKIKNNPQTREIPIIFISAYDHPEDIVKGFEQGCDEYIVKPFIPEVVKVRVNMQLKMYEATRRMSEMNRQLQASIHEQVKQIEKERRSVLYALLRVARENAYYEESYMQRLSYNCRKLAEAMQLSEDYDEVISDAYIDMIELAAPLCDLGNMAVPTNILQKTSELSPEENRIMRTHTTIGANILRDVAEAGNNNNFIQMAIEIANFHHENWDGSGYPNGLKGNEIPLAAQIVGVVGSFCALTEARTYRDAYSQQKAWDIMEQDSVTKYNPELFWILKKIARQLH